MQLNLPKILTKDYLVYIPSDLMGVHAALYGTFSEIGNQSDSGCIVQHGEDSDTIVVLHSSGRVINLPDSKFDRIFPLSSRTFTALRNDELHLLHFDTASQKLLQHNVGQVENLIVDRHISMFKQDGTWFCFPVQQQDSDFKNHVLQVGIAEPLFINVASSVTGGEIPIIVTREGIHLLTSTFVDANLLNSYLGLVQEKEFPQGRGMYQYKVADIRAEDIHRLLTLKPKQMEAVATRNNNLTLYFLTEDGKLYGTGSNSGGRLGIDDTNFQENKFFKEFQLIDENVQHIDRLSMESLMYSKDDGSYYVGPGIEGWISGQKQGDRPIYKFTQQRLERFGFTRVFFTIPGSMDETTRALVFYSDEGVPHIFCNDKHRLEILRKSVLNGLLDSSKFKASNFPHRDFLRFKSEALPEMIPC